MHGIPTIMISLPMTIKPVINLVMENKGKSEHTKPMAVFAESIKSYPVTAIQITVLWLRILINTNSLLNRHYTMHRQQAINGFLVYFLFVSTNKVKIPTADTKREANVKAPKADL